MFSSYLWLSVSFSALTPVVPGVARYRLQYLGYQPTRGVCSRNTVRTVSIFRMAFVFSAASSFTTLYIVPVTCRTPLMRCESLALQFSQVLSSLEGPSLVENDPHRHCQADLLVDIPHIPKSWQLNASYDCTS